MAGKMCEGKADTVPYLRDSKAYCDGRGYAAGGGLKADNPHLDGGWDKQAWDNGWDSWADDPANGPAQDCCAHAFGGGYVPP